MARYRDLLTIVLLNLAALGGLTVMLRDPRASAVRVEPPPTSTAAPTPTRLVLHVHVSGAVATPGVVRVPEGARADQAVAAAGGMTGEADPDAVNLAAALHDGQQLHVPKEGEIGTRGIGPAAGAVVSNGSGGPSSDAPGDGLVDLNVADETLLETLPGIGPALAARIVEHRSENGRFAAIDDLVAVPGIGERTLERLRDRVVVR